MSVDLAGRKILLIGGSGFIGSHVAKACLKAGAEVRIFDSNRSTIDGCESECGSFRDVARMHAAARGRDIAIFLGASGIPSTPVGGIAGQVDELIGSVVAAAEACFEEGVRQFVFGSSGGTVYGANGLTINSEDSACRPIGLYGAAKLSTEALLHVLARAYGARTVTLRISNPYGEGQVARGQGFIAAALQQAVLKRPLAIWGDGSVVRDFVYVGDVADAFVKACVYSGAAGIFNIGSGKGHSLAEIVKMIEQCGEGVRIVAEYGEARSGDIPVSILDVELAKKELLWEPRTLLEDGLRRTARWWLQKQPD